MELYEKFTQNDKLTIRDLAQEVGNGRFWIDVCAEAERITGAKPGLYGRLCDLAQRNGKTLGDLVEMVKDPTACSDCGKPSPAGLFYIGEQQLCGACAYKHA